MTWVLVGLAIIIVSYVTRVLYTRYMKRISVAASKFGKAWGKRTSRYRLLRILNSFFYILGLSMVLVGLVIGVVSIFEPKLEVKPPIIRIQQPDDKLELAQIFQLVNEQRKQAGLAPLVENPKLTAVAQARAEDMAKNQYYSHVDPQGKYYYDLFAKRGFNADYSCENLDVEFTTDEWRYVSDWLESTKGHKECMLNNRVSQAGYGLSLFGDSDDIYLVVGIHATELEDIKLRKPNQ